MKYLLLLWYISAVTRFRLYLDKMCYPFELDVLATCINDMSTKRHIDFGIYWDLSWFSLSSDVRRHISLRSPRLFADWWCYKTDLFVQKSYTVIVFLFRSCVNMKLLYRVWFCIGLIYSCLFPWFNNALFSRQKLLVCWMARYYLHHM